MNNDNIHERILGIESKIQELAIKLTTLADDLAKLKNDYENHLKYPPKRRDPDEGHYRQKLIDFLDECYECGVFAPECLEAEGIKYIMKADNTFGNRFSIYIGSSAMNPYIQQLVMSSEIELKEYFLRPATENGYVRNEGKERLTVTLLVSWMTDLINKSKYFRRKNKTWTICFAVQT